LRNARGSERTIGLLANFSFNPFYCFTFKFLIMENLSHLPDHLKRLAMMTTILEACHKSAMCSDMLNILYNDVLMQAHAEGVKLCTLFPNAHTEPRYYSDEELEQMHADELEFIRRDIINE
jgi:hypothetical protein